jgi:glyoxylase-like metal-dependent hydrolase (beta-lactamase superfamily II)
MRNVARAFVLAIACIAVVIVITVSGQQPDTLNIRPVKEGLYLINGTGGNVGVRVTSDGVILIDNKFPRNFEAIQERVREVTSEPVKYVINTHHHGDHAGGNVEYIKIAEVIAHQNARDNMIKNEQDGPPRIVFTKETAIHLGDTEVRAYHFGRGHTDGDSIVYFPDLQTIHGGDLLHGTAPFIDYANGGSSRDWITTLDGALDLDFDTAIPGHGELMTKADVRAFRDQFVSVRQHMTALIRAGVTKDTVATQIPTNELSWTMAPDGLFMRRSLPGFYDEMAAER